MPSFQYGKLPATRLAGVATLATYAKGKLPSPPPSVAAPSVPYPVDGNDQYGDCTIAGVAHLIAAWNAEVSESDPVPTGDEVVDTYFEFTGGADMGCSEYEVLETWRTEGLFGERIAAFAPVDIHSITELHQAVACYGGAYLGIACPESAQEQFLRNEPWTVVPGAEVDGGHCIVAVGYSPTALLCATWGGVAEVTYPFLARYLDEAYAVIPHQFIEAGHGPDLDLASLQADLGSLAASR